MPGGACRSIVRNIPDRPQALGMSQCYLRTARFGGQALVIHDHHAKILSPRW
jgi:hypothetical protein